MRSQFDIVGEITDVETFAVGRGIRELRRLKRAYGHGRWRKRKGIARVRLADGSERRAELHWYEAVGVGRKKSRSSGISISMESQYVICVKNDGYAASLELRKLYRRIPDPDAERHGQLRIVDESGEDYLYPEEYFASVQLSKEADRYVSGSA